MPARFLTDLGITFKHSEDTCGLEPTSCEPSITRHFTFASARYIKEFIEAIELDPRMRLPAFGILMGDIENEEDRELVISVVGDRVKEMDVSTIVGLLSKHLLDNT